MPENVDASSIEGIEEQSKEYTPIHDGLMHRVIVKDELVPGKESEHLGYKTDIVGAKVDLEALGENIERRRGSSDCFESVYFTTASGTIYQLQNLQDGIWKIESSNSPRQYVIRDGCVVEVGKRFQSPHHIDEKPELYTSPIQDITLVSDYVGFKWSSGLEQTDIAQRFTQAVRQRSEEGK